MLRLDVYLEGASSPVGQLTRVGDDTLSFAYMREDLPHPLSLSLPLREAPFGGVETRAFFSNLLFENAQRDAVMARHGTALGDIAWLLVHLGQDCTGAVSVVPEGAAPGKRPGHLDHDYDPLDAAELDRSMVSLRDHRRMAAGSSPRSDQTWGSEVGRRGAGLRLSASTHHQRNAQFDLRLSAPSIRSSM